MTTQTIGRETAVRNQDDEPHGSYAILCHGRLPVAKAELRGIGAAGKTICGALRFYATPLGLLIFAEVDGLKPSASGAKVYGLGFGDGGVSRKVKGAMPLLYERDGHAWGAVLTKKLNIGELLCRRIILREADVCDGGTILGEAVWTQRAS